ncbi:nuclear transport factor 2 family protein [Actinokineospora terrae]|uniref:nuclear transport factor 2 family protein n=1 Tax=Actinokineospora terrae TaxID=155974 RepID=UPI000B8374B4|nr:nuclear transport factor 2 family protein [Actinokineospora terrae]
MSDLSSVVDAYLAVWNRTDATARREMVEGVWSEEGRYVDPLVDVRGWAGVDRVVAQAQARFTGMRFVRGEVFEEHHNVARFSWELIPAAGAEAIVVGFDVAVVDDDGRLAAVYGFLDRY